MNKFDMVILDSDNHPPLEDLERTVTRIAYVSLGEAEDYRFYWNKIKDQAWVLEENPDWQGNYYVDVRALDWHSLIIRELIPKIIAQGFDGIMLDTIDMAQMLEEKDPQKFTGASSAMVQLIKKIHQQYPHLLLISNNGFGLLKQIAPFLNGVLVEDITMTIDFVHNDYVEVPQQDREYKIKILREIMHDFHLPVFSIDYVASQNQELVQRCLKQARQLGFKPYVAEKKLSRIYNPQLILE